MSIITRGVNHPAVIGRDLEETVRFYSQVLGMRLVLRQLNLDDPGSTHLFFDAGGGSFIAFFVPNDPSTAPPHGTVGVGSVQHIALNLAVPIEEAMEHLRRHGVYFNGPIDRGYERSLYLRDPNGIIIELITWITPLPEGADEAEVLARAQEIRLRQGASSIEDEHVRQALAEMGLAPGG